MLTETTEGRLCCSVQLNEYRHLSVCLSERAPCHAQTLQLEWSGELYYLHPLRTLVRSSLCWRTSVSAFSCSACCKSNYVGDDWSMASQDQFLIIHRLVLFMFVYVLETCQRPGAVHEGVWPSQLVGERLLRPVYLGDTHYEGELNHYWHLVVFILSFLIQHSINEKKDVQLL